MQSAPDLYEFLERVDEVSLFPHAAMRVLSLTRSATASLAELEQAVELDPVLAARVLKLVNSPLYGLPVPIGTLKRAIHMLGFSGTRDVAVALAMSGMNREQGPHAETMWRHAEATAWTCRVLARYHRRIDPDEIFVSGLVHDLGQQLMMCLEPQAMGTLLEERRAHDKRILQAEGAVFGWNHAQLGAAWLRRWRFPVNSADLVAYHHHQVLDGLVAQSARQAHALLAIADSLSGHVVRGAPPATLHNAAIRHPRFREFSMARGAMMAAFEFLLENRNHILIT